MSILQSAKVLFHLGVSSSDPNKKTFIHLSPSHCKTKAVAARSRRTPEREDTFAWNSLIQSHLANNEFPLVVSAYLQMLEHRVPLDTRTLPRVLDASRLMRDFPLAKQLHAHSLKLGFSSHHYAVTALIHIYADLGTLPMAQKLFDNSPSRNAVCWTLLARLYLHGGNPTLALALFHQMLALDDGVAVDHVAVATACSACGMMRSLPQARIVHDVARKCGLDSDVLVCNSLLKMYSDCDSMSDARLVFEKMPCKDVISWTSMICAYVKRGGFNEAFKLFREMIRAGFKPDSHSISAFLPACGRIASLNQGREIHGYLLRNWIHSNLRVNNALMDMYVKSGCITSASNVFAGINKKDTISWTIMIVGYSLHGQGKLGVDLFRQMKNSKVLIDDSAYAAALHACNTARMVEEGRIYFNRIRVPTVAHCALKVVLLVKFGLFMEARTFIEERGIEKHPEILRKLLEGCRMSGQYTMGKQIVEQLCELEPLNAENYVMLLNWYAGSGKWQMVQKMRETIRDMGLKPKKAYTWTLFRNKVHVFGTGDVSHPRSERIYSELQGLIEKMRAKGLEPNWDFRLHDVDEERECIRIGHSELLALSFGLISSHAGPIRLAKNSRMCNGCHSFAKFVSKMIRREIIFKDSNFFHHFNDGLCSCGDFW
ncbi:pentatricopeptide repeat-containing protein DOT4, chloroplastic-like isoform X1 [Arachis stenosperma]|uniref:pentatricopeptide repeat-containing protein DOT4, chloroplastic-like isoform X1 n=2 Tax=Arachis stenosperma TaxID=217475 RepID=UPI0025ABEE6D|nr:pentatricopeptide repeat-containing protein DOT4, chloroplastic-like isoform X1 [Arachis stenosperma]XP_057717947.1 pentatricopeptide repeat-containing protein DOT4, chloroplastic-like isoform X1 [Arachis stenosperma]XP_057717948.1 pentatricopeptide repeat-containing protein DOT4, chloroplastic-like isoform X1 [Arachis stenosperma]